MATIAQPDNRIRQLAAWAVHLYTALGLPLAFMACLALSRGEAILFFLILMATTFIDATDGAMARAVQVKKVLPQFDGSLLDNIVDFITFVFLPCLALPALGLIPSEWWFIGVLPVMASSYGFCQERAKTDDAFVGFPSYWNIVVLYLYLMNLGYTFNIMSVLALSILVFVPIHYVYPSRTPMLRSFTLILGAVWTVVLLAVLLRPDAQWARPAAMLSLMYPLYYTVISAVHHVRVHRSPT